MTGSTGHTWDDIVTEVRRVWADQLEPVRPELIHPTVSIRTQAFLTTVGLPTVRILDIVPIHDERLMDLVSRGDRRYVTVATNESSTPYRYGVDAKTGVVMYLEDAMPQFDCLANTNIAAFVLTLGLYKRHYIDLARPTKDAVWAAVDAIWDQLGEWDPQALRDENSRWNILLDEHQADYDG
jgi:SUKH-4 immunity protein